MGLDCIGVRAAFYTRKLARRPQPRVAFLHIPKCAGSSINGHFKANFGGSRSGRSVLLDSVVGTSHAAEAIQKASSAQYVAGHMGWTAFDAASKGAMRFTVVREPFARLKSLYCFVRQTRELQHPMFQRLAAQAHVLSFPAFCLSQDPDILAMTDNAIARTLADDFYPYVAPVPGMAHDAIRHLAEMHFVVEQSRLGQVFESIAVRTRTGTAHGQFWLNRTPPGLDVGISRVEFLSDARLRRRIELDLDVHEAARRLSL